MEQEVKNKPPTKRQRDALDFIKTFIQNNGFGPTMQEIAEGLSHKSKSTAAGFVDRLEQVGLITRDKFLPRSIRIVGEPSIGEELEKLRVENKLLRAKLEAADVKTEEIAGI